MTGTTRGIYHHAARMTEAKVRRLRAEHRNGDGYRTLGKRYGISPQSAHAIVKRLSWNHVK